MDNDALWIWRRLGDFERNGIEERKPCELFAGMSDTMQADVLRILPKIVWWLGELKETSSDKRVVARLEERLRHADRCRVQGQPRPPTQSAIDRIPVSVVLATVLAFHKATLESKNP